MCRLVTLRRCGYCPGSTGADSFTATPSGRIVDMLSPSFSMSFPLLVQLRLPGPRPVFRPPTGFLVVHEGLTAFGPGGCLRKSHTILAIFQFISPSGSPPFILIDAFFQVLPPPCLPLAPACFPARIPAHIAMCCPSLAGPERSTPRARPDDSYPRPRRFPLPLESAAPLFLQGSDWSMFSPFMLSGSGSA